jgi:hypothetical protein
MRISAPGYLHSLDSFIGTILGLKPTVLLNNVSLKASANVYRLFLRPTELRDS